MRLYFLFCFLVMLVNDVFEISLAPNYDLAVPFFVFIYAVPFFVSYTSFLLPSFRIYFLEKGLVENAVRNL